MFIKTNASSLAEIGNIKLDISIGRPLNECIYCGEANITQDHICPSGCEDCDFLEIVGWLNMIRKPKWTSMYYFKCELAGPENTSDPNAVILEYTNIDDLSHIKPPKWCPGG